MAIQHKADQQLYKGRGPLDAKLLKKTYAELLNVSTWTVEDAIVAYNGMIVAVWLNKDDTTKNGLYYLFDPAVTTAVKKPDVTNPDNWHKLCGINGFKELNDQVTELALQVNGLDALLDENVNTISAITAELEVEKLAREALSISVTANTEAIAKLNSDGEGSVQKIVTDAIAEIPIATLTSTGIVKASDEIQIASDGTMSLGSVSTDKLVKGNNTLVLNGGNSSEI